MKYKLLWGVPPLIIGLIAFGIFIDWYSKTNAEKACREIQVGTNRLDVMRFAKRIEPDRIYMDDGRITMLFTNPVIGLGGHFCKVNFENQIVTSKEVRLWDL